MKQKISLVSSTSILTGAVIAILALLRGPVQTVLLLLTFTLWGLWVVLALLRPSWQINRDYRRREERDAREQSALSGKNLSGLLLCHVNYRVSDYLKRVYPNARWEWMMPNPVLFIAQGGTGRICVFGVPDYEYADVTLDRNGSLDCSLVKIVPVADSGQGAPSGQPTLDPSAWYELEGRGGLDSIIADLRSRGHSMAMQGARFESCNLTENYLYIKVVNPRLTGEVRVGDVVQAGILISNSETGLGAVNVQPLVYRLACLNGMVVNDSRVSTRRNHVGRANSTDENFALYSQETLDQDGKAFMMKVQDTVRAAVDEARFARVLDTMKESTQAKLDTSDVPALVKLTSSNFGLTDAEGKGVLQHLLEGADYTLYGLANAVTRYSQDVEDYDRASKLEAIGYNVMTMPPAMLKRINEESAATAAMAA